MAATAVVAGIVMIGQAAAAGAPRTIDVGMYGNAINDTKDLSFRPKHVRARVGDTVRWTNMDNIVPHTATEDHGLWDLAGNYGQTPVNPAGVAPHASVQRTFEAGTQLYFCRVHPVQMHGEIDVPVEVRVSRRRLAANRVAFTIHVIWDSRRPARGLVFDVVRARGKGRFRPWLTGTSSGGASFTTTAQNSVWHLRARLRRASDPTAATGFSPDVAVAAR